MKISANIFFVLIIAAIACDFAFAAAEPAKGFISVCAWYILAKNKFNPMTLERYLII
ncbi:MAG: hypothetical protein ABSE89_09710 [Sedimentisphaerales bacterium]